MKVYFYFFSIIYARLNITNSRYGCESQCISRGLPVCKMNNDSAALGFCCDSVDECQLLFSKMYDCSYN